MFEFNAQAHSTQKSSEQRPKPFIGKRTHSCALARRTAASRRFSTVTNERVGKLQVVYLCVPCLLFLLFLLQTGLGGLGGTGRQAEPWGRVPAQALRQEEERAVFIESRGGRSPLTRPATHPDNASLYSCLRNVPNVGLLYWAGSASLLEAVNVDTFVQQPQPCSLVDHQVQNKLANIT